MGRPRKIATGIGDRLESVVPEGLSLADFSSELGVSDRTLGNYIRGDREPSYDFLVRLKEKTGVDLNWLLAGDGGRAVARSGDAVGIPRYSAQPSAGDGTVALSQDIDDYFTVSRDWLSRYAPANARIGMLEARGDSMLPTIADGDVLIVSFDIDRQDVANGGVFVITYEGNLFVKRLQIMIDGTVQIMSDNKLYDTEKVSREMADEHMQVHAQVIWSGGPLR